MAEKPPGMLVITTLPESAGTTARVVTSLDIVRQLELLHRVSSLSELWVVVESWWAAYWLDREPTSRAAPSSDSSS